MNSVFSLLALTLSACAGPVGFVVVHNNPCSVEATASGAVIKCPDGTQVPIQNGSKGIDGTNGLNGSNGHSAVLTTTPATSCANGGTTILMATDSNDNGSFDVSDAGISSATVCNGENAPPTPFSPVALLEPCGDAPGIYDEVLLRLSNGTVLASFSDNAAGANTRFSLLGAGTYTTTDGDSCTFTLDSSGNLTYQSH